MATAMNHTEKLGYRPTHSTYYHTYMQPYIPRISAKPIKA